MKKATSKPTPVKAFFDIVSIILEKKPYPTDEDIQKHCNQYMISQMLSCDAPFAEIAHEMGKLKISNKMYFECLYHGLPKCKRFIKWNASKAKKEQNIKYLMEHFGCSHTTAKQYEALISKEELDTIVEGFEHRGRA